MEKINKEDEKTTGIELFAKFAAASVKYSIYGGYVFFASLSHIVNRVKNLRKNGRKDKEEI